MSSITIDNIVYSYDPGSGIATVTGYLEITTRKTICI